MVTRHHVVAFLQILAYLVITAHAAALWHPVAILVAVLTIFASITIALGLSENKLNDWAFNVVVGHLLMLGAFSVLDRQSATSISSFALVFSLVHFSHISHTAYLLHADEE